MTAWNESVAVVLFQLGGPDSLEAVEPFLFNLFSDPDIIDFPFARLARPTLARLISSRRARHVQQHYASIGGKSPIRELTERQATALEKELRRTIDARVFVAMRYWHPLIEEAFAEVIAGGFSELILLPLYPQYSKTTTGSSLNEWRRLVGTNGLGGIPSKTIHHLYAYPAYLDALAEKINAGLEGFRAEEGTMRPDALHQGQESERVEMPISLRIAQHDRRDIEAGNEPRTLPISDRTALGATDDVHLVFSAHGVPVRVIESGDPYQRQVEETVRLVMERGGWRNPHVLCWQSRVNPGKWLEPSLGETLRSLAAQGAERVLVIPISFVTDHVETLAEIDIEARALAAQVGIRQFELMPALNDSPTFIRALAGLVLAQLAIPIATDQPNSATQLL
jgi:ferrochelatase